MGDAGGAAGQEVGLAATTFFLLEATSIRHVCACRRIGGQANTYASCISIMRHCSMALHSSLQVFLLQNPSPKIRLNLDRHSVTCRNVARYAGSDNQDQTLL